MIAQLGAMAQWTGFPTMFQFGSGQVLTIDAGSTNQVMATAYHTNGSGYLCAYKYNFTTSLWDIYQDGQLLNVNFSNAAIASDGTIWTAVGGNSYKNGVVKTNPFTAVSARSNSVAVGCTGVFAGENVYLSNSPTDVFSLLPTVIKYDKVDIAQDGTMCALYTYLGTKYIVRYNTTTSQWENLGTSYTDIAVGDANKVLAVKSGQLFYFHVASNTWIRDLNAPANVTSISLASDGTAYLLTSAASNNVYRNSWSHIACGAEDGATNTTPLSQQNRCYPPTSTTITASASGTVTWFTNTTTLTPISTGTALVTNTLTAGTYTYFAANTLTCGTSPRTPIVVTIYPNTFAPYNFAVGANPAICSGNTATLSVTNTGATVTWYDAPTGGNLLGTGNSFVTPTLTSTTIYYPQGVSPQGCQSLTRGSFTVTVQNSPTNISNVGAQSICFGQSTILSASSAPGSTRWYNAATGGTLLASTVSLNTGTLATTTTFYAENNNASCIPPRTPITVTVTTIPTAPINTTPIGNQSVCFGNTSTTLSASGVGTLNWFTTPTGGTSSATGNTYTNSAIINTTTYYVADHVGNCISATRTPITVTVTNVSSPIFSGPASISICSGNTASLTAASTGTISWFASPTGTTALITGTVYTTPTLTSNTSYYISTTSNGCESTRAVKTVTVKPTPAAPIDATVSQGGSLNICSGESTTLFTNNYSNWFTVPSGGAMIAGGSQYSTPSLTTNTTYYAEYNPNGCPSLRTPITVTVNSLPNVVSQTVSKTCSGSSNGSIALTLNNASSYSYTWSPNVSTTYSATSLAAGVYTVNIDNMGCVTTKTYSVTQHPAYNVPVNIVGGNILNFNDSYTGGTTFQWLDCNNGNAPISGAVNAQFTPTLGGSYALVVTDVCASTSTCTSIIVTGINENSLLNNITLQPNPASTYFTLSNVVEGTSVNIIEVTGKVIVLNSVIDANKTMIIETSNLSNGIYVIQLNNNGVVAHKKLIINK